MRLYSRSRDDQLNACRRAAFDAQTGRFHLGLLRLQDIRDEGPVDATVAGHVWYTEGVVRRDNGGQGQRAYECFVQAHQQMPTFSDAIINATHLAPTEEEFRRWVAIAKPIVPAHERAFHEMVARRLEGLDQGEEYASQLQHAAAALAQGGRNGDAAAYLELALALLRLSPPEEAALRRWRAQRLRPLDQHAEEMRHAHAEHFAPDERLVLLDALAELDRAIEADENDAEIWNLKASYSLYLERWDEALTAAQRSIQLRPHAYAKPHINTSLALWAMKRDAEALKAIQTALAQAEASGDAADQQRARELVEQFSQPRKPPSLDDWGALMREVLGKSRIIAQRERQESQGDPNVVIGGFFRRCQRIANRPTRDFVPILAELMSDFSPERVLEVVSAMPRMSSVLGPNSQALCQTLYDQCLHAALFIVAHSTTIMRRDAARFLWLTLFGGGTAHLIQQSYRESILEPSAAATDAFANLDSIMREELAPIHPKLVAVICEQAPVDDAGRQRARDRILSRFRGSGCVLVAAVIGAMGLIPAALALGVFLD